MKRFLKYTIIFIITLILFTIPLSGCQKDNTNDDTPIDTNNLGPSIDPNLLFEDNFDGTTFDATKWKFISHNNYKRRGAYYDEENIIVENGILTLRTEFREGKYGEGWYTAWLETSVQRHLQDAVEGYLGFATTTGYFEIRCKVSYSIGTWSAFWLMPDEGVAFTEEDIQGTATDGAEIDIMETNWKKNFTGHVIHYDGYDSRLKSVNSGPQFVMNMYGDYHTYAYEWTEDMHTFYIDGRKTWSTNKMGIPEVSQYMIISNEVGGYFDEDNLYPGIEKDGSIHWTGDVNKNSQQIFDFEIDYIRVYKVNPYN